MPFTVRPAQISEVEALNGLIDRSVRGLLKTEHTAAQIDASLQSVFGVDTQLVADQTYFVVEDDTTGQIIACGGWSNRKKLFGGDNWTAGHDEFLDPARDAAKIRALFVEPAWARRGIGTILLQACERAAIEAGFKRFEMGATLTGVPMY